MDDQTLLYWGVLVTIFLVFAGVLTAKELFNNYLEHRKKKH